MGELSQAHSDVVSDSPFFFSRTSSSLLPFTTTLFHSSQLHRLNNKDVSILCFFKPSLSSVLKTDKLVSFAQLVRSAPSIIPGTSSSEREDSVSPNLSNSPLQSMSGMTSALPGSNGYGRDSYDSNASAEELEGAEPDLPVDNEEAYEGQDDETEALKKYKGRSSHSVIWIFVRLLIPILFVMTEQMHSYLASRFASFKSDLERKTRAEGSEMPPTGLPTKRRNN